MRRPVTDEILPFLLGLLIVLLLIALIGFFVG